MDFGLTGKLGEYYLTQQYQKNRVAGKSDSVSFAELAASKAAGTERVEGMSFKDMWQARFPGAYYHVMDGSKISQGAWDRKALIVPPALEEKMQNDSELAEKVMANVENFIATYPAVPGCSYLIELDENGEISKYRLTSPGTITVSSSEFVEARRAREAKHAEYERLEEETALKRKMLAQETDRRYYQSKAVSIAAYEAAGILK